MLFSTFLCNRYAHSIIPSQRKTPEFFADKCLYFFILLLCQSSLIFCDIGVTDAGLGVGFYDPASLRPQKAQKHAVVKADTWVSFFETLGDRFPNGQVFLLFFFHCRVPNTNGL